MAFTVSGLTAYVKENKDLLTKEAVFGSRKGDTIANVGKELGVKSKARMHQLAVSAPFQDGNGCGFNASGNDVISEREIEVAILKVNKSWCPDDLYAKVYESEYNLAAGKEVLPFEAQLMEEINLAINKELERIAWQGEKATDLVDGFLTLAAGADSASTISVTSITSGMSVYQAVEEVYKAIPEDMLDNAVIFLGPDAYRQYILDLVHAKLYHYDPAQGDPREIFIPGGQNVKVHRADGLAGSGKIYASTWENMRFGTDMLEDKEEYKVWFSEDDDIFKLKIKFAAGFATVYPDHVLVGTLA